MNRKVGQLREIFQLRDEVDSLSVVISVLGYENNELKAEVGYLRDLVRDLEDENNSLREDLSVLREAIV